ncbi:MAG: class I SAM-dependent methyltransferase [Hyphomonadaceae bacterium]
MGVVALDGNPTLETSVRLARECSPGGLRVLWVGAGDANERAQLRDRLLTHPDDQLIETPVDRATPAATGKFHLIFAVSVLNRWPATQGVRNIGSIFPFTKFTDMCERLDARLVVGGVLVIANANYRFTDAALSHRYDKYEDPSGQAGFVSLFKASGERTVQRPYPFTIFRKLRGAPIDDAAASEPFVLSPAGEQVADAAGRDETPIQLRHSTKADRYPQTFAAARALVADDGHGLRVLSFGCSDGTECLSLAELYFNGADDRIMGVDVKADAIAMARRVHAHPRISYALSGDVTYTKADRFDAIFAMSVLCVWPEPQDESRIAQSFPFSDFEQVCASLDRKLKVGGVLVIYNSTYRFTDSSVAHRYNAHANPNGRSGFVRKYRADGSRIRKPPYPFTLFKKLSD